jgi:tetratricopeptide (TPR) repeat protein
MLRQNRISKADLARIPNYANDIEFAAFLEEKNLLTNADRDQLFSEQIEGIIVDILSSQQGEWSFSSLTRIRDGLAFDVDMRKLIVDYARCLPSDTVLGRFRSLEESFLRSKNLQIDFNLAPGESFVLSRASEAPTTTAEIVNLSAMPEAKALHAIYTLWVGGLLIRDDWRPAFSEAHIAAMRGAKLELKREARLPDIPKAADEAEEKPKEETIATPEPEIVISLDEYLDQVENAETYYDILGVEVNAEIAEMKRAYFHLARNFHPDRYHYEGGETLKRMQNAFTELAQAHETLKNPETREMYDYRMRKELAEREKRSSNGAPDKDQMESEQAAENFETGFSLLMEGDPERSLLFLARAVHFAPKNPRYHAYYGKALSTDDRQRHKAEAEMQTALRLDPNNPTFRILLAEFFIHVNLLKRAEGELTRLLAVFPSNREAQDLLAKLKG